MTTPTLGEIRLFAFSRAPTGWLVCDGSAKDISIYQELFILLGTNYGGDGVQTFCVPDLRGRVPVSQGTGVGMSPRVLGSAAGSEKVTLRAEHLPVHSHAYTASTAPATSSNPTSNVLGAPTNNDKMYTSSTDALTPFTTSSASTTTVGTGAAHDNLMPTLTASFCIAHAGIFPSRS